MQWLNEPPSWSAEGETITIHSAPHTDFWRVTAQNGIRDNAHFYYQSRSDNFQADVRVSCAFTGLWDQAGLMLRVNEQHWIKCSSEYFEDQAHACVVVTHEVSDWSIVDLPPDLTELFLRIERKGSTVAISYALDGQIYRLLRLTHLAPAPDLAIGLLCASPDGPGFTARYHGFRVQALPPGEE